MRNSPQQYLMWEEGNINSLEIWEIFVPKAGPFLHLSFFQPQQQEAGTETPSTFLKSLPQNQSESQTTKRPQKSLKAMKITPSFYFAVNFINSLKHNVSGVLDSDQKSSVAHVWILAYIKKGHATRREGTAFSISSPCHHLLLQLAICQTSIQR